MKTIVIYNTKTGFTKRYAQWISEVTQAEYVSLEEAQKRTFDDYDVIVFGGWACAGGISKLSWFKTNIKKWMGKKLIVYCVGGSPIENPDVEIAIRNNFSEDEWTKVHAFYCPGGFDYDKMSSGTKILMKMFIQSLKVKKNKTEEEKIIIKMISSSYDISDRKYIEPIVACING